MTRNPYFDARGPEGQQPGFVDRIEITSDSHKPIADLEAGRLDVVHIPNDTTPNRLAELRARLGTRLQSLPEVLMMYAWLNVKRPPFDDVRVRRALNFAVDRSRLVDTIGGPDVGSSTCQLTAPGCPATNRSARSLSRRPPPGSGRLPT